MKLDEFMGAVTPAKRRSKLTPHLADMIKLREQNYTLAQVCDFLARNGVTTSPSNVASYLHRAMTRAQPLKASTTPASRQGKAGIEPSAASVAATNTTETIPEQPAYGAHDPRRIDEVLRTPPDMAALVKRGRATRAKSVS